MNPEPQCDQELLIQAEFDDELDAAQLVAAQLHRRSCRHCNRVYEELRQISARLQDIAKFDAPGALRAKLTRELAPQPYSIDQGSTRPRQITRPRWLHVLGGVTAGAAAAMLAMLLLVPPSTQMAELVVDSHLRAQQSQTHLLDIVSTEHHVVKPWFAGQLPFAPPVKDLAARGYPLRGARIDVITGRSVAVLVYQAGRHTIDVFIWPKAPKRAAEQTVARGFNLRHWSADGMDLWAVSDVNSRELTTFVDDWQAAL